MRRVDDATLRLRDRSQTSYGAVRERELLAVTLTGEDGVSGYGEAAPLEAYDGVSIERVGEALERYRPVLAERRRGMNGAQIDRRVPAQSTICRRRWRRSTWRCGIAPGAARGGRWRRCITDTPGARRCRSTRRSRALDRAGRRRAGGARGAAGL